MDPCDLPAIAARALIGRKALSPVELLHSCLARIDAVDPFVNAVVARDDRALAVAREAEAQVMRGNALGPLHGLPVLVKDLAETQGLRTTFGSLLHVDHVPAADERQVAAIRAAGGIVLGKTNTPEFGAGANTRNLVYGATGNPFDPSLSAAGSSGGSAVALACGMAPLATGSDQGGSLRNPASFCGVVGYRPSPGVVADETGALGWSPLSVQGPMARDVADTRLLLDAMAAHDARDPLSAAVSLTAPAADLAHLRLAVSVDLGFAPVERAVASHFSAIAARIAPWFARADLAHPDCAGIDDAFAVLRGQSYLAGHAERVRDHGARVGPNIRRNVAEALGHTAAQIARAHVEQTRIARLWLSFFDQHDVLLTPAITIVPRPWAELAPREIDGVATRSYYHWLALAYAVSFVGHPAICLPCGLGPSGLPFGLQLVGRRGGDAALLAAAAVLEAALSAEPELRRPVPDLDTLRQQILMRERSGFLEMPEA